MTRRTAILLGLLILALLLLAAQRSYDHIERYTVSIDQGPSPEARSNPYLAAQEYLRQRSIPVNVITNINHLPDPNPQLPAKTLILLDSRENMTPGQADEVLQWVLDGGHLIFVAEQLWDDKKGRSGDLLLDRLHLRQYLSKDLQKQDLQESNQRVRPMIPMRAAPISDTPNLPWPELTRLYIENESAPAYIGFDTAFHLDDPQDVAQAWANSADSTHMLQLTRGQGIITVVTDADLWKTRAIGKYDNAWLLWYLAQDSEVTLVLRTDHDNLFGLLLHNFPLALTVLALLIVLSLWHFGLRHGPLQAPASRARRQLTEHLRASADFLLRHSGQQTLLRGLQQDILRRARQRHPGFEQLGVADQWQVLARLTRQSTSAVGQAMRPRPAKRLSSADFTRQVAHLQALRNAL
jgi:hypothetical protein